MFGGRTGWIKSHQRYIDGATDGMGVDSCGETTLCQMSLTFFLLATPAIKAVWLSAPLQIPSEYKKCIYPLHHSSMISPPPFRHPP